MVRGAGRSASITRRLAPAQRLGRSARLAVCVSVIIALSAGAGAMPAAAVPAQGAPPDVSEADWILFAQLPDGAITSQIDHKAVLPYEANYAAMGLARATVATGQPRYVDAAWRWLDWYRDHQDRNGFVTDQRVVDGTVQSTGDMDSTDAYAGTYLLAVREAWRAAGDTERLRALAGAVTHAVDAIEATRDADGLTFAKPGWDAKYLMDQAEAYAGLVAAVDLGHVVGDEGLSARARADAAAMAEGVGRLWNPATGAYDW